jgi:hypothetical protein
MLHYSKKQAATGVSRQTVYYHQNQSISSKLIQPVPISASINAVDKCKK